MRVAIVDDEEKAIEVFEGFISQYAEKNNLSFHVDKYKDGSAFLDSYNGGYDIVFMDIAMPGLNGIETARNMREIDSTVILIFMTSLAQYAIKGYEVDAFDYLVKPISYELFSIKLDKCRSILKKRQPKTFLIKSATETYVVPFNDIKYVESIKHYLFFHLSDKEIKMRGTLNDIKAEFIKNNFVEINRSLLVNLSFVDGYNNSEVIVAGETLPLSRIYKTAFLDKLTRFMGRAVPSGR